jgi:hypothetical protein
MKINTKNIVHKDAREVNDCPANIGLNEIS